MRHWQKSQELRPKGLAQPGIMFSKYTQVVTDENAMIASRNVRVPTDTILRLAL